MYHEQRPCAARLGKRCWRAREKEALKCKNVLYFRGAEENWKLYTSPKFTASLGFKKRTGDIFSRLLYNLLSFLLKPAKRGICWLTLNYSCARTGCVCHSLLCMYVKRDTNPFGQTASDKKRERATWGKDLKVCRVEKSREEEKVPKQLPLYLSYALQFLFNTNCCVFNRQINRIISSSDKSFVGENPQTWHFQLLNWH